MESTTAATDTTSDWLSVNITLAPPSCREEDENCSGINCYTCDVEASRLNDYVFLLLAMISHIIYLMLSKREKSSKWNFCRGHPGIMFPLNMLDGYESRLAYSVLFGSMTFELTAILWGAYGDFILFGMGGILSSDPVISQYPFLGVLAVLIQVAVCTFLFYPLFASLTTRYKFAGSIIGMVLTLYKLCSWLWLSTCVNKKNDCFTVKKYMIVILLWPCIVCLAILLAHFMKRFIQSIRDQTFGLCIKQEPIAEDHHMNHVRYLLGKQPLPWTEQNLHHLSIFSKQKLLANFGFSRLPGFKFPTRVLATFIVTMLALYQIGLQVIFMVFSGLKILRRHVRDCPSMFPQEICNALSRYTEPVMKYANIAAYIWIVTMIVNIVLALVYVYHTMLCYRKHMLRVYRGDRSIFPLNWIRESNSSILTSASRHAGLQIAYTIWGFVIIQVFEFMIVCGVIFILIIPALDFHYYGILEALAQVIIAPLALTTLIYYLQVLLTRVIFLQKKVNDTDAAPPLALDNRKTWNNVSFFFFFWNLFLGVVSALMRILKGLVLGVFFIPRIDRPVLMRGFEKMDNGFYAYLCLLSVIHAHDHPVVKSFVHVLVTSVKEKKFTFETESLSLGDDRDQVHHRQRNSYHGSKRARYYWFLAYTLIHNPDLLNFRKVEDTTDTPTEYGAIEKRRKHKIVLAIHRKKQGHATSSLYRTGEDDPCE